MSELNLTPEARRCLWQCYSFLLRLAEEADGDTFEETEFLEASEKSTDAKTTVLNRLDDNTLEVGTGK